MKVLNERDLFLSDFEVYDRLKTLRKSWEVPPSAFPEKPAKKKNHGGLDLEIITSDIVTYLDRRACGDITVDSFKQLMVFLNTLDLVKVEKLQIVNSLPRSMVHLYSLIDECDQRFEESICIGILEKIEHLFPRKDEEQGEEEQEEQEEA